MAVVSAVTSNPGNVLSPQPSDILHAKHDIVCTCITLQLNALFQETFTSAVAGAHVINK